MNTEEFICQSCSMPLGKGEQYGTNEDGSFSKVYCLYCYKDGKFTEPNISMQDMINKCTMIISEQNIMPKEQALELMSKVIPSLSRWKK